MIRAWHCLPENQQPTPSIMTFTGGIGESLILYHHDERNKQLIKMKTNSA